MKLPKMILFDYGETLVHESKFDGVRGIREVLKYAINNKYNKTAEEVYQVAEEINDMLGRFDPKRKHLYQIEIPTASFYAYLFESQGISLSISYKEAENIIWNMSTQREAMAGVDSLIKVLNEKNIRTGVISNISCSGDVLKKYIHDLIPNETFEVVISSADYIFRKPNERIFQLALEKVDLKPEEVWYCGDNYECDIIGAKKAGIKPIWFVKENAIKEDFDSIVIHNWKELEDLIEN